MAHFAELDENNVVLRVTVVNNEVLLDENNTEQESLGLKHLEHLGGKWVQTSYNKTFRKNYAGTGYTFDGIGFAPPKPFASWTLNPESYLWEAPVGNPKPQNGKNYEWQESTQTWLEV